jgi:hypothetical protein
MRLSQFPADILSAPSYRGHNALEVCSWRPPKHLPAMLLLNILAIGSLNSTISVADVVKRVDVLDARPLQLCKCCEASRTCPLAFNFSTP